MKILGVDPGTIKAGYGIIEEQKGAFHSCAFGTIRLQKFATLPEKLEVLYAALDEIMKKHSPDTISIETAFYGKNVQSALKIGYARGAAMLAAIHNGLPVHEYAPREIKKAVTGNGAASKEQVGYMIKTILNLKATELNLDESDAFGAALCYAFTRHNQSGKSRDWKSFINEHPDRVMK